MVDNTRRVKAKRLEPASIVLRDAVHGIAVAYKTRIDLARRCNSLTNVVAVKSGHQSSFQRSELDENRGVVGIRAEVTVNDVVRWPRDETQRQVQNVQGYRLPPVGKDVERTQSQLRVAPTLSDSTEQAAHKRREPPLVPRERRSRVRSNSRYL